MNTLPVISIPKNSPALKDTANIPGMDRLIPSSPPVNPLNFVARTMASSAMARVIIAKKMAFTLRERKLIITARAAATSRAIAMPSMRLKYEGAPYFPIRKATE